MPAEAYGWAMHNWYDNPGFDTPQQPVEMIKDGITLDFENYQNKLFVNEEGEYLLNSTHLFMLSDGQNYISKSGLLQALIKVAEGRVEHRGHLLMLGGVVIIGMAVVLLFLPLAG